MNDTNSVIEAQKEQILRYQSRLKGKYNEKKKIMQNDCFEYLLRKFIHFILTDVVTAYKSLLKEKEALDISLSALTNDKLNESSPDGSENPNSSKQLNTVLASLATLSAEKSRMEASFQADKKNMRQEMAAKDKEIEGLKEKLKNSSITLNMEKENFKAKLTSYERRLADESHLRDSLDIQLNQLKTQFSQTSNSDKLIKDLNLELAEAKKKLKAYESNHNKFNNDSSLLQALQSEMENLKQQHLTNIMTEKQRANEANEKSRRLTAIHEERVQSLEARLSELSVSVTQYHNSRESDQRSITQLKDKIAQLSTNSEETLHSQVKEKTFPNVNAIIDEIERLKHLLIYENTKLDHPIDLSSTLLRPPSGNDATVSAEKYAVLKQDHEKLKIEIKSLRLKKNEQAEHIATLQEKIQVLNQNIDEYEKEIKKSSIEIGNELKQERSKWRNTVNAMEIEHRSKISQLEQQLQKQRERSLGLLEEKENEIRTLKTSYELFVPKRSSTQQGEDDGQSSENSEIRKISTSHHLGMVLNQPTSSSLGNLPETHMIYYSNELARKEMELTSIRKAKREAESLIRQTLKEKIMLQEELDDRIMHLEQQVDRYY